MRFSWKLGRVAGIDIYLHPTLLILLAVVGLSRGEGLPAVALVSATFGCVLLHELGHALAARQFGIATQDITLYPIGGVARLHQLPRAPGAELVIALAGPAVNVAIAVVLGVALIASSVVPHHPASWVAGGLELLSDLQGINLLLAVFNLLPAFPMDGGRVLRALLSLAMGRGRATEVAATLGQFLALSLPVAFLALGYFSPIHLFLAGFLFLAAGNELAQVRAEERRRRHDHDPRDEDRVVWYAPPGYDWVNRGAGIWQLAPIVVTVPPGPDRRWS